MAGGKRLSELGLTARAGRDPVLSGLTADSRAVREGMLFAAWPGTATAPISSPPRSRRAPRRS
jgi:UDP-N-acetylmuramoyl-L-alanyl-D-glutamate--2,6-diaminopimelate ligase